MKVYIDDGSQIEIKAGDVVAIPPGHDAEVPGPESAAWCCFDDSPWGADQPWAVDERLSI